VFERLFRVKTEQQRQKGISLLFLKNPFRANSSQLCVDSLN